MKYVDFIDTIFYTADKLAEQRSLFHLPPLMDDGIDDESQDLCVHKWANSYNNQVDYVSVRQLGDDWTLRYSILDIDANEQAKGCFHFDVLIDGDSRIVNIGDIKGVQTDSDKKMAVNVKDLFCACFNHLQDVNEIENKRLAEVAQEAKERSCNTPK